VASTAADGLLEARAAVGKACDPGYCLRYVRGWLDIPPLYPDATTAWRNATGRHVGDRTPPMGAPVFWTGGPRNFGHIAIYAGGGRIVSTDLPTSGRVGLVELGLPAARWGHKFAGWAEGFNGQTVLDFIPPPPLAPEVWNFDLADDLTAAAALRGAYEGTA
jgi:hypothetical protein